MEFSHQNTIVSFKKIASLDKIFLHDNYKKHDRNKEG